MALLRSLLTGVSGLRAQQTAIDVTGDNIANVSTTGFKQSRVDFSTLISQNFKFPTAPGGFLGGTNPGQIGLGVQVADIQKIMTQGALRATGVATDLAIDDGSQARSFFIANDHTGQNVFTRDGSFALNSTGQLFDSSNGFIVQGWMADTNTQVVSPNGDIDFALTSAGPTENLSIELGNLTIAKETTFTDYRGNLNGGGDIADNATVLESDQLFDYSSGTLIEATESTLLANLVRSSTGDNTGNAVDLNIELGSTITIAATVGGSAVNREFVVGDPPPTGGLTLGDLRDFMQGSLGIDRSSTPGNEMISAQRIDVTTGEALNGTLDQTGAAGYNTLTLSGAAFHTVSGAAAVAGDTGTVAIGLDITNPVTGASLIGGPLDVTITGTGAAGAVTNADIQTALNSFATGQGLASQFSVSGSDAAGYTITNTEGNDFAITDDTGASGTVNNLFGGVLAAAPNEALGVAQQPVIQVGDTIQFGNFTPVMAVQTLTAVAAGTGNGTTQFEVGATAAETATNLATAINMNTALSGIATASVVGNQVQLLATTSGSNGNFTITTNVQSLGTTSAVVDSTYGVEAAAAVAGDEIHVAADSAGAVTSTTTITVDTPGTLVGRVDGTPGATTLFDFQVNIAGLTGSPFTIQVDTAGFGAGTETTDLAAAIQAAINADASVVNGIANAELTAGVVATGNDVTGVVTITSVDNATVTLSAVTTGEAIDDYGQIFSSASSTSSNGVRVQLVPQGGSAKPGYTAVEVQDSPALTAQAIAQAINSSATANPPISASAIGTFIRLSDNSTISGGLGNAIPGANIVPVTVGGFVTTTGTTLVGAGASADTFNQPASSDFVDGVATAEMIDDEVDFVSAGVQVGDFIRFSTGNAAGMIAKITAVGMREDPTTGTLITDPHALRFEVQSTDNFPASTVPSAYTLHEAASVDIGVNSNLAAANPPTGLDTASDAGVLRIAGHVGSANTISNLELRVSTNNMQSVLAGFTEINDAAGESFRTTAVVFDSLGIPRQTDITFWLESKSNAGTTWRWAARAQDNNVTPGTDIDTVVGSGTIDFDPNGQYLSDSGDSVTIQLDDFGVDEPLTFSLNFASLTGFAADVAPDGSVANPTEVFLFNQDGFKAGTLDDFTISTDGRITGLFDNGLTRTLGQLAVARFANSAGLDALSENYFTESVNSGQAIIGTAGSAGRGIMRSGFLEESNVELAEQFTNLIQQQRAYQANARTITTSNQLLQELVNLI